MRQTRKKKARFENQKDISKQSSDIKNNFNQFATKFGIKVD
jgi:hypothetical protein